MSLNAQGVEHERSAILGRMREEISAICMQAPDVWRRCLAEVTGMSTPPATTVLTGCGDSYYAGLAVRQALEAMLGTPVVSWPAMDVVSYPSRLLDDATLVAVSVSGKVGRTIDAVTAHNSRGAATVAVTAHGDSDLGQAAGGVIATGVRGTPGPVPGTANYVASMLGLLAFGAGASTNDGDAAAIESTLAELPQLFERASNFFPDVVASVEEPVFIVGSGPDFGTANFASAKLLEAAGAVGVPQDLEEWAHEQYFTTRNGRTVLIFGNDPSAEAGARQVAQMATAVGGQTIGVGRNVNWAVSHGFHLPDTPLGLSPLLSWVPAAVFALEFAQRHQGCPFGIDQPGRMNTVDANIYVSSPSRT